MTIATDAVAQTRTSSIAAPDTSIVANVEGSTRDVRMLRKTSPFTMETNPADTVGRSAATRAAEGAIIGLTVGALAGGVLTIVGDESGNLGWNVFLLAIPGAVLGGILGLIL